MTFLFSLVEIFHQIWIMVGQIQSRSFPRPLSAAQESKYLQRMAEGDLEARQLLIEHNLRLVAHVIKKFEHTGEEKEDLLSIGSIGLIKAVNTFNPSRGPAWLPTQPAALKMRFSCFYGQPVKRKMRSLCRSPSGWTRKVTKLP